MTGGELKEIKLPHCSDNTASSLLLIAVSREAPVAKNSAAARNLGSTK